ncbi:hypothetical protein PVAP13_5NG062743 [Panicum virgatum]|uniref:Uncharacterized protein n=1 Tax=Panicum virgatum TaxID=38727 RepID=A0A8T0RPY5_PANVG|nr:hypothetical protein PVAP13_5NG062743 [Panicum virgatum]
MAPWTRRVAAPATADSLQVCNGRGPLLASSSIARTSSHLAGQRSTDPSERPARRRVGSRIVSRQLPYTTSVPCQQHPTASQFTGRLNWVFIFSINISAPPVIHSAPHPPLPLAPTLPAPPAPATPPPPARRPVAAARSASARRLPRLPSSPGTTSGALLSPVETTPLALTAALACTTSAALGPDHRRRLGLQLEFHGR